MVAKNKKAKGRKTGRKTGQRFVCRATRTGGRCPRFTRGCCRSLESSQPMICGKRSRAESFVVLADPRKTRSASRCRARFGGTASSTIRGSALAISTFAALTQFRGHAARAIRGRTLTAVNFMFCSRRSFGQRWRRKGSKRMGGLKRTNVVSRDRARQKSGNGSSPANTTPRSITTGRNQPRPSWPTFAMIGLVTGPRPPR